MDIIDRINKLLPEEGMVSGGGDPTTSTDIDTNQARGHIDVVGGKCKPGYEYCPKKKVCVKVED